MKRNGDRGVTRSNIEPSCRPFNQSQLNKPSTGIEGLRKDRQTMKERIREWFEEVFWVRLAAYNNMKPWKMPHTATTWLPLFHSHNPSLSLGSWDWCYWPNHYGVVKTVLLIWFGDTGSLRAKNKKRQYSSTSSVFSKWQPFGPCAIPPSYYLSSCYCPLPFSTALKISCLSYSLSQLVSGWGGCKLLCVRDPWGLTEDRDQWGDRCEAADLSGVSFVLQGGEKKKKKTHQYNTELMHAWRRI